MLFLLIVTGRPAAGKSTLANWLGEQLGVAVAVKDVIREQLFDELGWGDREWASKLGRMSIERMFEFARDEFENGRSVIFDNAFDPSLTTRRILTLKEEFDLGIMQIVCDAHSEILWQRFKSRAERGGRHPGHGDFDVLDQLRDILARESSPVMALGGLLIEVDTNDFNFVDFDAILGEIQAYILNLN